VLEILPEFRRQSLAFMARLQILLQLLNGGIRHEGDEPSEAANLGTHETRPGGVLVVVFLA
jgi:hypothetical protein